MDYKDYQDLDETSVEVYTATAAENEFFHSIFIGGDDRTNDKGLLERAGYLHIRGVEANLDTVYMVVIHTKQVLAKMVKRDKKEKTECFCYQSQRPWVGSKGNICPETSAERRKNEFCAECRAQYILAGILTDKQGRPKKDENDKFIFVFIRARGMKYSAVFDYIKEMSQLELTPIFQPQTEESKRFEKSTVNIRRFVTQITKGSAPSAHGTKSVFKLSYGNQLPDGQVPNIMKISQSTLEEFHEKFDWSRKKTEVAPSENVVSGYGDEPSTPPTKPANFDDNSATPANIDKLVQPPMKSEVSFEDFAF